MSCSVLYILKHAPSHSRVECVENQSFQICIRSPELCLSLQFVLDIEYSPVVLTKVKDKYLTTGKGCHVLWSSPLRLYFKGVTMEDEVSFEKAVFFFYTTYTAPGCLDLKSRL